MQIPKLEFKEYPEYHHYSKDVRSIAVFNFLFKAYPTRKLDNEILLLDSTKTNGWRSFEILGYMGLKNVHKGLFQNNSIDEAIEILKQTGENCSLIIEHLEHYSRIQNSIPIEKEVLEQRFSEQLAESQKTQQAIRLKRIESAESLPEKVKILSTAYKRNPDITAEVLFRANGICEKCKQPAPFKRAKDNTPYLEIHHRKPLAKGGRDDMSNTMALCPNCHREMHFG